MAKQFIIFLTVVASVLFFGKKLNVKSCVLNSLGPRYTSAVWLFGARPNPAERNAPLFASLAPVCCNVPKTPPKIPCNETRPSDKRFSSPAPVDAFNAPPSSPS